jgi:hypothetical protein
MFIEMAAHMNGQQGWSWVPHPAGPAAEFAYTREELIKLLRAYGNWASIMTRGAHVRVTIRGRFSGRWLAQTEWAGGRPLGEPWVHIPAWDSLPFRAQLHIPRYTVHDEHRLVETGGTDVSTLRLSPVADTVPLPKQDPYVRNKEDVPHEHALPDLYGEQDGQQEDDRFTA